MKKPRVSVIMPAYNAAECIGDSINTVLRQTYGDFELLVVDDASTDDTAEVVGKYQAEDGRVRLVRHAQNMGVAGAINTGLENAAGELLARADSDDLNRPYRFEAQVDYLDRHPDVAILGGGYAPFNEHGHRMDIYHPAAGLEIAWRFLSNTFFCHPTVMFRRAVYETMGAYPRVEAEDYAYFSAVLKRFKGANLRRILIDYRESLGNRSNSAADRIARSVRLQAADNYRYYSGDDVDFERFFAYQQGSSLAWRDWPRMLRINRRILRRIANDYRISRISGEYIRTWMAIMRHDFIKLFRRQRPFEAL